MAVRSLITPVIWTEIQPDAPSQLACMDGGQFYYSFTWPDLFTLPRPTTVNTLQVDLYAPRMSTDRLRTVVNRAESLAADWGINLLEVYVCEKPVLELVLVPDTITLSFLGQTVVVDLPGSGIEISVFHYRFWILTQNLSASPMVNGARADARAAVVVPFILAMAALLVAISLAAGVIAVSNGDITLVELTDAISEVIEAPGEAVGAAVGSVGVGLAWPFIGLGIILLGGGLALPRLQAAVDARIARGPVQGGVKVGLAPAPAPRPPAQRAPPRK